MTKITKNSHFRHFLEKPASQPVRNVSFGSFDWVHKRVNKKWQFQTVRYSGSVIVSQRSLVNGVRPVRRVVYVVQRVHGPLCMGGGTRGNGVRAGRSIHAPTPWYGSGTSLSLVLRVFRVQNHCFRHFQTPLFQTLFDKTVSKPALNVGDSEKSAKSAKSLKIHEKTVNLDIFVKTPIQSQRLLSILTVLTQPDTTGHHRQDMLTEQFPTPIQSQRLLPKLTEMCQKSVKINSFSDVRSVGDIFVVFRDFSHFPGFQSKNMKFSTFLGKT